MIYAPEKSIYETSENGRRDLLEVVWILPLTSLETSVGGAEY